MSEEKKKRLVDSLHMFDHDGMRYGLFRNNKPYGERSASEMQEYYRKKMGMDSDDPITMTEFRKLLKKNFHIDVKSVPAEDRGKATDKERKEMSDYTAGESDKKDKKDVY